MGVKYERFGLVSEIDASDPATYRERIYLTFDVDWAPDFVIRDVDRLLRSLELRATWFITHESEAIDELRLYPNYEIGVHPDFSPLLMGKVGALSLQQVIDYARSIAPSATAFRCHSLVQSTPLLYAMFEAGFTLDCNPFLPFTPIEALFPWRHGSGPMRIPYCWEDDTWVIGECRSPKEVVSARGLAVVDFHPIHLWLNSESLEVYEQIKHDFGNEDLLRSKRNNESQQGVLSALHCMVDALMVQQSGK